MIQINFHCFVLQAVTDTERSFSSLESSQEKAGTTGSGKTIGPGHLAYEVIKIILFSYSNVYKYVQWYYKLLGLPLKYCRLLICKQYTIHTQFYKCYNFFYSSKYIIKLSTMKERFQILIIQSSNKKLIIHNFITCKWIL